MCLQPLILTGIKFKIAQGYDILHANCKYTLINIVTLSLMGCLHRRQSVATNNETDYDFELFLHWFPSCVHLKEHYTRGSPRNSKICFHIQTKFAICDQVIQFLVADQILLQLQNHAVSLSETTTTFILRLFIKALPVFTGRKTPQSVVGVVFVILQLLMLMLVRALQLVVDTVHVTEQRNTRIKTCHNIKHVRFDL